MRKIIKYIGCPYNITNICKLQKECEFKFEVNTNMNDPAYPNDSGNVELIY